MNFVRFSGFRLWRTRFQSQVSPSIALKMQSITVMLLRRPQSANQRTVSSLTLLVSPFFA